jgi:hypothetical protein
MRIRRNVDPLMAFCTVGGMSSSAFGTNAMRLLLTWAGQVAAIHATANSLDLLDLRCGAVGPYLSCRAWWP